MLSSDWSLLAFAASSLLSGICMERARVPINGWTILGIMLAMIAGSLVVMTEFFSVFERMPT